MQQDHGGAYEDVKPNQDRRLRPMQGDHDQPQQQQPQKCPRCESSNTKFCYYNNYSLSQPRYFCKTCRRYWTLGGTLRNVPVGGGCRKGKRTKTSSPSSSSGENSRPQPLSQPHLVQQNLSIPHNMVPAITINSGNDSLSPALMRTNKESGNLVSPPAAGIASVVPSYYPGTGFLTSLAAIQSLNTLPSVNIGDLGDHASSNLGLLHAFNTVHSLGSQNHLQHRQFYHVGGATDNKGVEHSFYPPDHQENLIQSSRPGAASSPHHQQQNWHLQGFINNAITNPSVSDTALWSTINTSTTIAANSKDNANNSTAGAGSSSLNHQQDQWPDVPAGFGPPP